MNSKIRSPQQLAEELSRHRRTGSTVVFTNGCFDLLHVGHVRYLRQAKALGSFLVVAVNSDRSVKENKGPSRPIQSEGDRAEILAALEFVDYVTFFDPKTPLSLIELLLPDVLVKGADWSVDEIVGKDVVEAAGGRVVPVSFEEGYSTTAIIRKIQKVSESRPMTDE